MTADEIYILAIKIVLKTWSSEFDGFHLSSEEVMVHLPQQEDDWFSLYFSFMRFACFSNVCVGFLQILWFPHIVEKNDTEKTDHVCHYSAVWRKDN